MPLPWYIHTMTKVFSLVTLPFYPYILTLEAMRGAFLSVTSLALFIDIPSNPTASANRELASLKRFLDANKILLEGIPFWAQPLFGPWIDYHHACECFLGIATDLSLQKAGLLDLPKSCEECWTGPYKPPPPL